MFLKNLFIATHCKKMRELGYYCFSQINSPKLTWAPSLDPPGLGKQHQVLWVCISPVKQRWKYLAELFWRINGKTSLIYKYLLGNDNILCPAMVSLTETLALLGSQACQPLDRNYTTGFPSPQASHSDRNWTIGPPVPPAYWLTLQILRRSNLHNHTSQFLIISLFLYSIHLLVLFLWELLTNIGPG